MQYRNYLSGGVDPNFESGFVFNRMELEDNTWPAVYERQYIEDGAGLRGLAKYGETPIFSTETSWGINFTQAIKNVPVRLFADYAGATDLEDSYFDLGLILDLEIVKVYLPLYQSWDEDSVINDFGWLKERVRFEIVLDSISIGM